MADGDILTGTTDYDLVRDILGVDSTDLPDATITSDAYLTRVEDEVKATITDYGSLADSNLTRIKNGVAAWVAALLCGYFAKQTGGRYKIGDYEEKGEAIDWMARAMELTRQAASALGSISTRTWTRPSLLVVGGPTRSRSNIPTYTEEWLDKIKPPVLDWFDDRQTSTGG